LMLGSLSAQPQASTSTYYQTANHLFEQKAYQQAAEYYSIAIEEDQQLIDAYYRRANCYYQLQSFQQAVFDLDKVIAHNYFIAQSFEIRAIAHFELGNLDQAIDDYTSAINILGTKEMLYIHRGNIYFHQKNYKNALVDFEEAKRLAPSNYLSSMGLGETYLVLRQYEMAIQMFDQAIALANDNPYLYNNRGDAKERMNQLDGAAHDFSEAIARRAEPDFFTNLAHIYIEQKQFTFAREAIVAALTIDDNYEEAYYCAGLIEFEKEQYEAAVNSFDIAILLYPEEAMYHFYMGKSLFELGLYYEAIDAFYETQDLAPELDGVSGMIAKAFGRINQSVDIMELSEATNTDERMHSLTPALEVTDLRMLRARSVEEEENTGEAFEEEDMFGEEAYIVLPKAQRID